MNLFAGTQAAELPRLRGTTRWPGSFSLGLRLSLQAHSCSLSLGREGREPWPAPLSAFSTPLRANAVGVLLACLGLLGPHVLRLAAKERRRRGHSHRKVSPLAPPSGGPSWSCLRQEGAGGRPRLARLKRDRKQH